MLISWPSSRDKGIRGVWRPEGRGRPIFESELEPGSQLADAIDAIDTSHVAEGAVADVGVWCVVVVAVEDVVKLRSHFTAILSVWT